MSDNKRGGKRDGSGRPRKEPRVTMTLKISVENAEYLEKFERGKSDYVNSLIDKEREGK